MRCVLNLPFLEAELEAKRQEAAQELDARAKELEQQQVNMTMALRRKEEYDRQRRFNLLIFTQGAERGRAESVADATKIRTRSSTQTTNDYARWVDFFFGDYLSFFGQYVALVLFSS